MAFLLFSYKRLCTVNFEISTLQFEKKLYFQKAKAINGENIMSVIKMQSINLYA